MSKKIRDTGAEAILLRGMEELGLAPSSQAVNAFFVYLEELRKWNRAYNLTGQKTDRDIVVKNFLDSLLFCKVIPSGVKTLADAGSGAGFPGIPIKIMMPDLGIYLIEPTGKKALFLNHICGRLGLSNIAVINKRVEDVDGLKVDAAVTRALFSVKDFILKASSILASPGLLILSKGPKVTEELAEVEGEAIEIRDLKLPFEQSERHMVLVTRVHHWQ